MSLKEKLDEANIRREAYFQGQQDRESELLLRIESLSAENGVKDKALKRAIEAVETLQEEALGYGYAEGDAYRWPFRDELLDQLKNAVSTERVSTGQTRNIGEEIIEGLEAIRDHPEKLKRIDCTQNGNTCPGCGGPADNGHDRSIPPNPYYCVACHDAGIVDHD